jgi:hypothetical protein
MVKGGTIIEVLIAANCRYLALALDAGVGGVKVHTVEAIVGELWLLLGKSSSCNGCEEEGGK